MVSLQNFLKGTILIQRLLLFCLFPIIALSHPHVFVDVGYDVKIKPNYTQIDISWTLDEMNSQMLLFDFGIFSGSDITQEKIDFIEKEYFSNLAKFDYYSFISFNGKTIEIPPPTNFRVSVDDHKLSYHFTLKPKLDATYGELKIGSFDAENLLALDIISAKTNVSTTIENMKIDQQIAFENKDYFVVDVLIIRMNS